MHMNAAPIEVDSMGIPVNAGRVDSMGIPLDAGRVAVSRGGTVSPQGVNWKKIAVVSVAIYFAYKFFMKGKRK